MSSLPHTHKALVVVDKGNVEVRSKPLPVLEPDTVLVRTKAVALNPTDWFEPSNFIQIYVLISIQEAYRRSLKARIVNWLGLRWCYRSSR